MHTGYKYWLTIIDDCMRWLILAPLRTKDEAYTQWVIFTTELFTQYGIKVKLLQSDNGAVFTSHQFQNYLKAQGTKPRLTVHDTPEQNGVAENVHQHIMNSIRVNLLTANLPERLWWFAALYVMCIYSIELLKLH
jgi:transposase InsO family protein